MKNMASCNSLGCVFWFMTACSVVSGYQRFRVLCCVQLFSSWRQHGAPTTWHQTQKITVFSCHFLTGQFWGQSVPFWTGRSEVGKPGEVKGTISIGTVCSVSWFYLSLSCPFSPYV